MVLLLNVAAGLPDGRTRRALFVQQHLAGYRRFGAEGPMGKDIKELRVRFNVGTC